jgi:hypothetical protein
LSRRTKIALAVGVLVVVAIAAVVSIIAVISHRASPKHAVSYSSQVALPFTELKISGECGCGQRRQLLRR